MTAGRPKSKVDGKKLLLLISKGNSVEDAAILLGVDKRTLERNSMDIIHKGRAQRNTLALANLFKLSKTNPAAAIWLSKQWLGMKDVARIEHAGEIGGPNKVDIRELTAKMMQYPDAVRAATLLTDRMSGAAAEAAEDESVKRNGKVSRNGKGH